MPRGRVRRYPNIFDRLRPLGMLRGPATHGRPPRHSTSAPPARPSSRGDSSPHPSPSNVSASPSSLPRFAGLVPPVPTPILSGRVDTGAFARIADHLARGGVDAAFVLGSTGELPSLSESLRADAIAAAAAAFRGRLPLLVGVGDTCLDETRRLADLAADAGAAAVVLSVPSYYELGEDDLRPYLDRVVPALPLPVLIYNMPWLTGHSLTAPTLRHALAFPGLSGFKDSSGDLGYLAELVRIASSRPELSVLVGSDFDFLAALRLGAHGCVAGGSNLYPGRFRRLLDAHRAGRDGEADLLQAEIAGLGRAIFGITGRPSSVFAAVKGGLAALGLCSPEMLPPLRGCSAGQVDELRARLAAPAVPAG